MQILQILQRFTMKIKILKEFEKLNDLLIKQILIIKKKLKKNLIKTSG